MHFHLAICRKHDISERNVPFFSEAKGNYFNVPEHAEVFAIKLFLTKALQNMTIT